MIVVKSVLLALLLTFTGGVLIQGFRTTPMEVSHGSSLYVSVSEIADNSKEWRKAICTSKLIIGEDTVVSHNEKILLFFNSELVAEGDELIVKTKLQPILNKGNPGEFDARNYWRNKNIYQIGFVGEGNFRLLSPTVNTWFGHSFSKLRTILSQQLGKYLNVNEQGVARALILGDKSLLSTEEQSRFSNAGAMHVLAVSGLHVGIILYLIQFVLSRFTRFLSRKTIAIISILIIWFYAGLTGFSPSVLRASFMFSVLMLSQLSSSSYNSINVLFFTAFVLLVINPLLLYDIGFQLSYLAMVGIFTLYPIVSKWFYFKNKILLKAWQGTAVGISAQAFTVPLSLYYFHQFPNYFMLTNLGVMVFAGVILGTGLLFLTFSWVSWLAIVFGKVLQLLLVALMSFVFFVDWLPFSVATGFTLSSELLSLVYFLIIVAILNQSTKLRLPIAISLICVFGFVQAERYENLNKQELVVLNADDLTFIVKDKNQIICLHRAKKDRIERVEFLAKQYTKVSPGNLKMIFLDDGCTRLKVSNSQLVFCADKNGVEVKGGEQELYVRTTYSENILESKNSIDMGYLDKNPDRYNLNEGAKIFSL